MYSDVLQVLDGVGSHPVMIGVGSRGNGAFSRGSPLPNFANLELKTLLFPNIFRLREYA